MKTLGIGRRAIDLYIAAGMPHDQEPYKGGTAYRFNAAEVHAWIVAYEVEQARSPATTDVKPWADQRERLAAAQAEKYELQVAEERAQLVRFHQVEAAWDTAAIQIRDLLRTIPMGCVDRVMAAVPDGKAAVKALLQAEIDDALTRCSELRVEVDSVADEVAAVAA